MITFKTYIAGCPAGPLNDYLTNPEIEELVCSASSSYDSYYDAQSALLTSSCAWSPALDDLEPWWMVNFTHHIIMYSWETRGSACDTEWVTSYEIQISDWWGDWYWIWDEDTE